MWTLLVTWAVIESGMYQDMYIISDPVFYSQEACIAYGTLNREQIFQDAMDAFPTSEKPESLYCLDEAARNFIAKKGYKVEQL